MFFPLAISESVAFATEKQIITILTKHFYDRKNWIFMKDRAVWFYHSLIVDQLRRMFPNLSSAAFIHIIRSMKKAGVIQTFKTAAFYEPIQLTYDYIDSNAFKHGGIEIVDASAGTGRYRPVYRSQGATLSLGGAQ